MQAAHAIHRPAAANGQISHVETFRCVVRILAAQGQQVVEGNSEFFLRITAEVLLDERRSETIKPAATAVWVVKRFPARVAASATSKGCAFSCMKLRARSNTAKAA
jgi:hypothetical protein